MTYDEKEGDGGATIHLPNHLTKLAMSPVPASRYGEDSGSGTFDPSGSQVRRRSPYTSGLKPEPQSREPGTDVHQDPS